MQTRTVALLLLATAIAAAGHSRATAQAGASGMAFLKLGVTARSNAMADAMTAHATGSAATVANPAGLAAPPPALRRSELQFMHREWIQDSRIQFIGAGLQLGEADALGFAFSTAGVSDIEIRNRPGTPEATFDSRSMALSGSYARQLDPTLRVGVTLKLLYEKILIDDATGWGLDLGAQFVTPWEGIRAGALLANLGSMSALRNESSTLPASFRGGLAYDGRLAAIESEFTLAGDAVYFFPSATATTALGGELRIMEYVAARAGYQFGSTARGFSAGLGLRYGFVGFDYAYAPLSEDLGQTHTLSLVVGL